MCGIAGYIGCNVNSKDITKALLRLKRRGTDATGMAWHAKGHTYVLKSPMKADDFLRCGSVKKELSDAVKSPWCLLHTRAATHGDPKNNLNNHPIYNEKGLIIHNGIVFPESVLPAQGQTDTEQILLYIQEYGWKGLEKVRGSMAIAYLDFRTRKIYLYRHFAPMVWANYKGGIAFASAKNILRVPNCQELPPDTVFEVDMKGALRKVAEVKSVANYVTVGGKAVARIGASYGGAHAHWYEEGVFGY